MQAQAVGGRTASGRALDILQTPFFLVDEVAVRRQATLIRQYTDGARCRLLYSVKANPLPDVITILASYVDGFGVSSLSEAHEVRTAVSTGGNLHAFSVAIRPTDVEELTELADYVSVNSFGELSRHRPLLENRVQIGLRINPGTSFVEDPRYDPCRSHSKLGVPLPELMSGDITGVNGIHVHANCDSHDLGHIKSMIDHLAKNIPDVLDQVNWVNLGGGYLFEKDTEIGPLAEAVEFLQSQFNLSVFIEPGATFVRNACSIVATVLDIFNSSGKTIAILDTTVNHMPEVFEYQIQPDVVGHINGAEHSYTLAGLSCLAGDLFGEYNFDKPLTIGSRVVFENAGAYTLAKAHTFNGIALPSIYTLSEDGSIRSFKNETH